ncbi:hypothetical protein C9F11_24880 [Streptomyces sp. YIM 121038]|nr:hypothetical protein C9F11_24880 [Streptomyces sp. YIM 121038]
MRRAATAVLLLAPLLLTGCAQSVDPIERLGRKAAEKMSPGCAERPLAGPRAERPPSGRSPSAPAPRAEPTPHAKRCPKEHPPTASPGAPR